MAKFKYPAECVAHRCPGHSLGTAGTVPAELYPALRTHLREHHGDSALLVPHGLATDPPQVLAPKVKPGIWFHDLPALATLRGTVAAMDAGTTLAGMAMAGVAQSGPEAYRTHVASGVGTSQEGEAMILLSYIGRLAQQPGVFWLVPDSEAVVGALRTYQEGGHCGDGIHHLYATVLGGRRLSLALAINMVNAITLDNGPECPCGCGSPTFSLLPIGPYSRPAPVWRPDPATIRSAPLGRAGTGPNRSPGGERRRATSGAKGGVPFQAALHRGGTWCLAPCLGGRTGAPGQSSWGCCPCGAP